MASKGCAVQTLIEELVIRLPSKEIQIGHLERPATDSELTYTLPSSWTRPSAIRDSDADSEDDEMRPISGIWSSRPVRLDGNEKNGARRIKTGRVRRERRPRMTSNNVPDLYSLRSSDDQEAACTTGRHLDPISGLSLT